MPVDNNSTAQSPTIKHDKDLLLDDMMFSSPPCTSSRGPLHPGSVWEGLQRSGRNSYNVRVKIDTVDLQAGTVTGLLQIQHLTPELDSLVTFFEGQIIGDKAGFKTARWGATEADDLKHWCRFPAFTKSLRQSLQKPNLTFKHLNKPYLFMRWKEQFVVPSSNAQNIHGASFAGFYYLCLDMDTGHSDGTFASEVEHSARRQTSPPPARSGMGRGLPRRASADAGIRRGPSTQSTTLSTQQALAPESRTSPPAPRNATLMRGRSYSSAVTSSSSTSAIALQLPPPRPRRASSATVSYAAAVRGTSPAAQDNGSDVLPIVGGNDIASASSPSAESHEESAALESSRTVAPTATSSYPPGASTPKELDGHLDFSTLSLQSLDEAANSLTGISAPGSRPIDIPQQQQRTASGSNAIHAGLVPGAVLDRDRVGVSPTSLDSTSVGSDLSGLSFSPGSASPMSVPEETSFRHFQRQPQLQQQRNPAERSADEFLVGRRRTLSFPPNVMRDAAPSLDAVLLASQGETELSRHVAGLAAVRGFSVSPPRSSRVPYVSGTGAAVANGYNTRRSSASQAHTVSVTPHYPNVGGSGLETARYQQQQATAPSVDDYGLRSYTQAKMTGFYFFRHSEPYQELSLRYVPGGGSSEMVGAVDSSSAVGCGGVGMGLGGRRGAGEAFAFR